MVLLFKKTRKQFISRAALQLYRFFLDNLILHVLHYYTFGKHVYLPEIKHNNILLVKLAGFCGLSNRLHYEYLTEEACNQNYASFFCLMNSFVFAISVTKVEYHFVNSTKWYSRCPDVLYLYSHKV